MPHNDDKSEKPLPAVHSTDDRRRWAKDNLERRLADHGMTGEAAHQKAAQIAREADRKKDG